MNAPYRAGVNGGDPFAEEGAGGPAAFAPRQATKTSRNSTPTAANGPLERSLRPGSVDVRPRASHQ